MARMRVTAHRGSGKAGTGWQWGTPEHALMVLALVEFIIFAHGRFVFRNAHGG